MSRFIVAFIRKGKTQSLEVDADDKLEARTVALTNVFGPGTYWDADCIAGFGWAVTAVERRRGKKTRFVDKKRSQRYRVHVERVEAD